MNPLSISFLSSILIIIFQAPSAAQNLINSTCKTSHYGDPNISYNFCTTSLEAAPASQCATLTGLGSISIRLIRNNITDTRCHIRQLLKKNTNPYVRQCLEDCLELYSDAITSVEEAITLYKQSKFDDANARITSIMSDSTTCEDGFQEREGVVSPLTTRNAHTFQLSAMALAIMGIIQPASL